MRRLVLLVPALAAAVSVTAGCAPAPQPAAPSATPSPSSAAPADLPAAPEPSAGGPCPYLTNSFVSDANGQKISKVKTSADKPHPSCFFYALNGKIQLTVRVYVGSADVAKGLVDQAAPVSSSNPATEPTGWQGGYQAAGEGAVYAVGKGSSAVIVTTNQKQSVKARKVTEQAIGALKL
ncbi:DUF2020 domain-containing protein [Amycolatopsis sp. H20-H5]|uniref:DUF2020 domain-containing protein n=1 Tax=Amycolatopsis sp. H20-H5 TaxID=3046309 RepID=UPI002DB78C5D|nr:DUF2020 domain-containing protein [Amycolatopsis sp. H20-H5]MEC3974560.1 DUF2020 domain-containing protein [Amycolatopsis sp. H20-H5]